jgi:hypothetical protein
VRIFGASNRELKLWLVTNHKPTIRGTDYAMWRRIRLIPFAVTISDAEKDPMLLEKVKAEATGILAWAVQGCLDWQRVGLAAPKACGRGPPNVSVLHEWLLYHSAKLGVNTSYAWHAFGVREIDFTMAQTLALAK